MINKLVNELYQILFIGSLLFSFIMLSNFIIKFINYFKTNDESNKFRPNKRQLLYLFISTTIIISYLI